MTDDLTTRLLAAIEAEAQRDTHDRKCMLFTEPDEGWCDRDCRERTERHCAAHRKIVEEYQNALTQRKEHHGDLALAGALLTMLKVVKIVAEGYDLTTEPAPLDTAVVRKAELPVLPKAPVVQADYYSPDPLRRYAAANDGLIFDTPEQRAAAEAWAKTQDRPGYPTHLNVGLTAWNTGGKVRVHDPRGYHYGPTAADPDPGSMWHYSCGQQVHTVDDAYVCGCGAMWTEDDHGRVTYIDCQPDAP